jgi:mannitol operon transcriptional antiterminator
MLTLSSRQRNIVELLLNTVSYLTIKKLAKNIGVSERSLRHDLDYIESVLSELDIVLKRVQNRGIGLELSEYKVILLRKELESKNIIALDDLATRQFVLFSILLNENASIAQFGAQLGLSYATVKTIISDLNKKLSEFNIEVKPVKGYGLNLIGDEYDRRLLFNAEIKQNLEKSNERIIELLNGKLTKFLLFADRCLDVLESKLDYQFIERQVLKYEIAYGLLRASLKRPLDISTGSVQSSKDFKVLMTEPFLHGTEPVEIEYITKLVLQTKIAPRLVKPSQTGTTRYIEDDLFASQVSNYIVQQLINTSDQDLTRDDNNLLDNLYLHLKVALFRIQNHILIENQFTSQIRIEIPLVYELTKQILSACEKTFNIVFNDAEVAYVAIHIAAAFENLQINLFRPKVAIICQKSISTLSYIQSRLTQYFPFCDFIGCYKEEEIIQLQKDTPIDLLISTHPTFVEQLRCVQIETLVKPSDFEMVQAALLEINYTHNCHTFLESYRAKSNLGFIRLSDFLALDEITIVDSCFDWEAAIKLASRPLLANSKITVNYVGKIIEMVKKYGSYMVLIPEVAFVHAGTGDGINMACASILVSKDPICFGGMSGPKVHTIVVLGIKEKDSFLLNMVYVFENKLNRIALKSKNITKEAIHNMQK